MCIDSKFSLSTMKLSMRPSAISAVATSRTMSSTNFRVFIGFFGNDFFVGAFEQAVKLAACLCFHAVDDFFDTDFGVGGQANGNVRTLVVRAVLGNFFGTRTQRGYGHHDFQIMAVCAVFDFARQGNVVVQQGLDAGNRCGFFAEEGEGNADFAGMGV